MLCFAVGQIGFLDWKSVHVSWRHLSLSKWIWKEHVTHDWVETESQFGDNLSSVSHHSWNAHRYACSNISWRHASLASQFNQMDKSTPAQEEAAAQLNGIAARHGMSNKQQAPSSCKQPVFMSTNKLLECAVAGHTTLHAWGHNFASKHVATSPQSRHSAHIFYPALINIPRLFSSLILSTPANATTETTNSLGGSKPSWTEIQHHGVITLSLVSEVLPRFDHSHASVVVHTCTTSLRPAVARNGRYHH